MTNFRHFQTDKGRRWQFQTWWKWQKVFKTVGKGEITHYEQFLHLPQCFQRLVLQTRENQGLFGKGLSHSHQHWQVQIERICRQHIKFSWNDCDCTLTHYQMTNFRLFQTERVCRRQFQIWQKRQKVIQMGRKHCGKRRNCSLRSISPFPTVFSKALFPRGVERRHCVGMC